MNEEQPQYRLCYAFPDTSASFAHGFEAGRLAFRLLSGESLITETVTQANKTLIRSMAEFYQYSYTFKESKDPYINVSLEKLK
jgi:hypothetical protein